MSYLFEQRLRVRSHEYNGDETGAEWRVEYVLYETSDENDVRCFELYECDDRDNGVMICRGYKESDMRHLTLRLGDFVEWRKAA